MAHGLNKVHVATMASGGTMSGEVDLGRCYQNIYLVVPTMATASNGITIYSSDVPSSASGVYRVLMHPPINSSTVTPLQYIITSSSTNCIFPIQNGFGLRYLKVNTNATVQDGCLFKFICGD